MTTAVKILKPEKALWLLSETLNPNRSLGFMSEQNYSLVYSIDSKASKNQQQDCRYKRLVR